MKTEFVGETWRLKSGLLYAGLNGLRASLVGPDNAIVFDSRDNQELKLRFYCAILGCRFEIESCAS